MRKGAAVLRVALVISLVLGTAQALRADEAETLRAQARDATAEYNMGHFKEALARFQAIYKGSGKNALLFNIAQCQRQMGNLKDAAFSYRRFIELDPDNPNVPVARDVLASVEESLQKGTQAQTRPPKDLVAPDAQAKPTGSSSSAPKKSASAGAQLNGRASYHGFGPTATHKVVINNDSATPWTECDIRLPTNKHFVLKELAPGESESIMMMRFAQDGAELDRPLDSVDLKCAQGEAHFKFGG
jgi:tetratricopeptide (TPR) repeat protein